MLLLLGRALNIFILASNLQVGLVAIALVLWLLSIISFSTLGFRKFYLWQHGTYDLPKCCVANISSSIMPFISDCILYEGMYILHVRVIVYV